MFTLVYPIFSTDTLRTLYIIVLCMHVYGTIFICSVWFWIFVSGVCGKLPAWSLTNWNWVEYWMYLSKMDMDAQNLWSFYWHMLLCYCIKIKTFAWLNNLCPLWPHMTVQDSTWFSLLFKMPHAVTFHVPRPSTRSMIVLSCFSMFFIQCLLLQVQRNRSVILQCGVPVLLTNAMTLHVTSVAPLMRWWPQEASARCWPVMMELPALAWMKFGPWVTLTWRPFSTTWSHCWYWCISLCIIVIYSKAHQIQFFRFSSIGPHWALLRCFRLNYHPAASNLRLVFRLQGLNILMMSYRRATTGSCLPCWKKQMWILTWSKAGSLWEMLRTAWEQYPKDGMFENMPLLCHCCAMCYSFQSLLQKLHVIHIALLDAAIMLLYNML